MKKILLSVLTLMCAGAVVYGQSHEEVFRFSNYNYGFGTARSAALGGAFTALGADITSTVINPAGLGLYRGSEVTVSPSLGFYNQKTDFSGDGFTSNLSQNKTHFDLNSLGGAINVFNGTGTVTSATVAMTYNRLADYNGHHQSTGRSPWSLADIWVDDLNTYSPAISPDNLDAPANNIYQAFHRYPVYLWNPIMGYQSYLIDYDEFGYYIPGLSGEAVSYPYLDRTTSGIIGEYSLSAGINLLNVVYIGASLGIQDLDYRETSDYSETYSGNEYELNSFTLRERLHLSASAVNFKIGVIAAPANGFRIGLAYHSPSYVSTDESYWAEITTRITGEANGYSDTPYLLNHYKMRTPSRLLTGLSYQFDQYGLISLDYEHVWYDKMKMRSNDDPYLEGDIDAEVRDIYQGGDNFRLGIEAVVDPSVFLRFGYGYYGSMYKNLDSKIGTTHNISGGIGYRNRNFTVDLAYIYMLTHLPDYVYYDYVSPIDNAHITTGSVSTKSTRNNIVLTLGMRF